MTDAEVMAELRSDSPLNIPAPRESWLPYPYFIATDQGPQPVDRGKARGAFAVHRGGDGWHLTHLPTGALLGVADAPGAAMEVADAIVGIRNWSLPEEPAAIEKDVVSAMLRSRGLRHPRKVRFWTPSAIARPAEHLGA
ncbi:hypothetical protein [Azospirillum argentinense]|uniref:hypothetical protein n=1 Tax=Azospirillum argentinense TaxID=2970906 RepID=UPI0032DF7DB4